MKAWLLESNAVGLPYDAEFDIATGLDSENQ